MIKNDEIIVDIIDMGVNGEGVAKYDNAVVFVAGAYIGEKVKVLIILAKSKFFVGKILEIIEPSEFRVNPKCPVFSKCGGCQLQFLQYEKQLEIKNNIIKNALISIGKIDSETLENVYEKCESSNKEYGYRNKVSMPVRYANNYNAYSIGMYANFSHRIVENDECYLQDDLTKKAINVFKQVMNEVPISAYNELNRRGLVRHVVARSLDDKVLITIVINGDKLPYEDQIVDIFKKNFTNFGLYVNINKEDTNVITGKKYVHIYGLKELTGTEYGISYSVVPQSFMQVNDYIKKLIYSRVVDEIKSKDYSCVIDAYSGAGLMSAMIAKNTKKVIGIEIMEQAVESANILAKNNELENLQNICGDCSEVLPDLAKSLEGNFAVVLDPPRKGCDRKVIESLISAKPSDIYYVSCSPATLSRDIQILTEDKLYSLVAVKPFDMFSQTSNIETFVHLKLN